MLTLTIGDWRAYDRGPEWTDYLVWDERVGMSWLSGLEHVVRENEPLAAHCWLRVGGTAQFFAEPTNFDELQMLITRARANNIPTRLLGSGSNLVIRDKVLGVVVQLSAPAFNDIKIVGDRIKAGGGTKLAHVIASAAREGLAGLEPLAGIPGTVGGALHSNAGNRTTDVGQWLKKATVLKRSGELKTRTEEEMTFAYRESSLNELAIVETEFECERDDPAALTRRLQKLWIVKRTQQPTGETGTICLFKDPLGASADALIEQAGLKNVVEGSARVSERNANYIVVESRATSDEVLKLVDRIRSEVQSRLDVELEPAFEVW